MSPLTPTDLRFVLSRLPADLRKLMQTHQVFLAGGFIRATIAGERVSDIDLFVPSMDVAKLASMQLALSRNATIKATPNALTLLAPPRHPVQFITRWLFNDAWSLVDSFDYTVARAVIWWRGDEWLSCCDDGFYPDLAARRLTYCAPVRDKDSGGSLLRARKFLARGYSIQAESLAAVCARLMKGIDPKHLADEPGLAKELCNRLREVDPLTVIDGCEIVDEHQVSTSQEQ